MIRGNHEDIMINVMMGFEEECRRRFNENTKDIKSAYQNFNRLFETLPIAAVIEKSFFCCHGGLGPLLMNNYKRLQNMKRPIFIPPIQEQTIEQKLVNEILWCDPSQDPNSKGFFNNDVRGGHGIVYFSKDKLVEFLKENNFKMFIRAHQVVEQGYEYFHDGLGVTVFSATNYCGIQNNSGAILIV